MDITSGSREAARVCGDARAGTKATRRIAPAAGVRLRDARASRGPLQNMRGFVRVRANDEPER